MDKAKAFCAKCYYYCYAPEMAAELLNEKGKDVEPDGHKAVLERERSTAEDGDEIAKSVNEFSVRLLLQVLKRLGIRVQTPSFTHPSRRFKTSEINATARRGRRVRGAAVDRHGARHVPDRLGERRGVRDAALTGDSRLDALKALVDLVASAGDAC